MKQLSYHLIDIAENSVRANAENLLIRVVADGKLLTLEIEDDGEGMDKEFLQVATEKGVTTKTMENAGMGLYLLKEMAESVGGEFSIKSQKGVGTVVRVALDRYHTKRKPMGNLGEIAVVLLSGEKPLHLVLQVSVDGEQYVFDSKEFSKEIDGEINQPKNLVAVKEIINEKLKLIGGAKI